MITLWEIERNSKGMRGQTYIWMTENNIVEVPFDKEHLLEIILTPLNLNRTYRQVIKNMGNGGIGNMSYEQLLSWLKANRK